MLKTHQKHLVCPTCKCELELAIQSEENDRVREGTLSCRSCARDYPIRNFIPRFLLSATNYAETFGFEWNRHPRTQYDSYTGVNVSQDRFFNETRWPRDLRGEIVLEAGCGSGRFTEQAVSTSAMVVSFDYSSAVEAAYKGNGAAPNLLIVQASIFEMPFRDGYFDKVFCIGVIQHTPDPAHAFECLNDVLKRGGRLVIDAYKRLPWWKMVLLTKYWVRPFTRKIAPPVLHAVCERWVRFWWPITGLMVRLTGRRYLSWFLLVADYRGIYPLPDHLQLEWSILDTFDMVSPAYDYPQTLASVRRWFERAGMNDVEVQYGYNGIEGRGRKA